MESDRVEGLKHKALGVALLFLFFFLFSVVGAQGAPPSVYFEHNRYPRILRLSFDGENVWAFGDCIAFKFNLSANRWMTAEWLSKMEIEKRFRRTGSLGRLREVRNLERAEEPFKAGKFSYRLHFQEEREFPFPRSSYSKLTTGTWFLLKGQSGKVTEALPIVSLFLDGYSRTFRHDTYFNYWKGFLSREKIIERLAPHFSEYYQNGNSLIFPVPMDLVEGQADSGGVGVYDLEKEEFRFYQLPHFTESDFPKGTDIHKIREDGEELWIATAKTKGWGYLNPLPSIGLIRLNLQSGRWCTLSPDTKTLGGYVVSDILRVGKEYWFATENGITRYIPSKALWLHYVSDRVKLIADAEVLALSNFEKGKVEKKVLGKVRAGQVFPIQRIHYKVDEKYLPEVSQYVEIKSPFSIIGWLDKKEVEYLRQGLGWLKEITKKRGWNGWAAYADMSCPYFKLKGEGVSHNFFSASWTVLKKEKDKILVSTREAWLEAGKAVPVMREKGRSICRLGGILQQGAVQIFKPAWTPGMPKYHPQSKKKTLPRIVLSRPNYATMLQNGNILLTDEGIPRVLEVRRDKRVIWKFEGKELGKPMMATRLENGNTLIADEERNRVIEVSPDGKILWRCHKTSSTQDSDPKALSKPTWAQRLSDGKTLIADYGNGRVIEVDKEGQISWQFVGESTPTSTARLTDGRTLITGLGSVKVVQKNGEVLWEQSTGYELLRSQVLPNGNFFLSTLEGTVEMSDGGTILRKVPSEDPSNEEGAEMTWDGHLLTVNKNETRQIAVRDKTSRKKIWAYFPPDILLEMGHNKFPEVPIGGIRLKSGTTLMADDYGMIKEVDSHGQVIWYCGMPGIERDAPGELEHPIATLRLETGNTIILQFASLLEVGKDHKVLWRYEGDFWGETQLGLPDQLVQLSGGHFLAVEKNQVVELNKRGQKVWEYRPPFNFLEKIQSLENGNIFIASHMEDKMLGVTRKKKIVWSYDISDRKSLANAERLSNGRTLVNTYEKVFEIGKNKKLAWEYVPPKGEEVSFATKLNNGDYLFTMSPNHHILEVNPSGKIVWQYGIKDLPGFGFNRLNLPERAVELPNGHIFIYDKGNHRLLEVGRDKVIYWEYGSPGMDFSLGC